MIYRVARDELRQAFAVLRSEQTYTQRYLAHITPSTDDPSVKLIYNELVEKINFNLPSQSNADPAALTIQELYTTIEKAELFLGSDLEYVDPDDYWPFFTKEQYKQTLNDRQA
jgi:hypothetical protein